MTEQLDLSPDAIEAIRDGQYTLLLGAGGSMGAASEEGKPLPNAQVFAQELAEFFKMEVTPGTPLAYVWDAAAQKAGSEQSLRERVTTRRFLSCRPAKYHYLLPTFVWKRIFTFNIDDVIPASYKIPEALQTAIPIHFDQDYKEADPVADECQVVYLHGSELFPDRPLVFGPPAYAATVTRQHTWWHVFATSFVSEPFIVIGASLREPDFETYLAWKRRPLQAAGLPSLFVSPGIDDAIRATCERLGLVPVQMAGDQFLTHLATQVSNREKISHRRARSIRSSSLLSTVKSIPALATLARQFLVVNQKEMWPTVDRPAERFLEGYTPRWEDIRDNHDVPLGIVNNVVNHARSFFTETNRASRVCVLIIEGTAGSGKTTALMRAAVRIVDLGVDTLFFIGRERLRDEVLTEIVEHLSPTENFALVIDDVRDHIQQVVRFLEKYPTNKARCFLLGATRSAFRQVIESNLKTILEPRFEPVGRLVLAEAHELEARLRSAAKLGRFAGRTAAELAQKFVSTRETGWAGQLLAILLEVVPGGVFSERLISEWKSLQDEHFRTFYGAVCIAAACGVPVRSPVALRAVQTIDSRDIFPQLNVGSTRSLVEWFDREFLRPRHRVIGEETVRHCMNRDELFEISHRLALALSPYVSRDAIMNRIPEARLARELMDTDGVVIPKLRQRAEEWFALLETGWGWNSRYWEQRALTAMKARRYSRARDFAEQAVGTEHHPLPMTTCALVNLVSVEHDGSLSRAQSEKLFAEAVDLLDEALRMGLTRNFIHLHPYHVLLAHAVRVSRKLTGGISDQLRLRLELHAPDAERFFTRDAEIKRALDKLRLSGIKW